MNIIVVDDETLALKQLETQIKKAVPNVQLNTFVSGSEALGFAEIAQTDIAFLDIEMGDMTGLALARRLKALHPKINIIFVTGHAKYAFDAMQVFPSGYLLKPANVSDIQKQLAHLREPVSKKKTEKLTVHTFGNFDVKKNGAPVHFGRSKSKEVFAYLIDRKGAEVTTRELAAVLFEDKPFDRSLSNQISTYITDMLKSLKDAGSKNAVMKVKNSIAVNVDEIECDYYNFLQGDADAVNAFTDEYMTNYSWAEFTLGALMCRKT